MLFLENLKPLKIYRKPLFLPTVEGDKKKRSAIFLLTPNYESSKAAMTSDLFINRLRFASYYIEKDLTYFVSSKAMSKVEDVTETYVRDFSEFDFYQSLCEMDASTRNALKDSSFGLPKKRKYPLNDADHVRSAIRFFNYVDKEDEAELARNIKKAIKKFNVKVKVRKNNRFSKYYTGPVTESSSNDVAIYEGKVIDLGNSNYSYKFYDGENEVCEVCIDYGDEKDPDNYIYELHVNPSYRRHGIGAALIEYAIDTLGGDTLCVEKNNKVALHMYEEAGFEITGTNKQDQYIMTLSEDKMYAKERNALKNSSFGLPSKRKYPLNDEDHVRAAIRFFNKVDKADEAELAKNIKKAIKKFGMDVNVGKDNRFYNYYQPEAVAEEYIDEDKLYAKERNALKDSTFGIPSKRKYPLNDEDHVRAAIRFFNKVDKEDEETLANNIKKAIKKFGMKVNVGKDNRFSNYYTAPVTEEYIEEDKMYAKERNALKSTSFGIPSKRKFPLNDKDHVKAAIRFFNKVDKDDEATLARNLNAAINKFFSKDNKPKVGKNNRFSKYYTGPVTEEAELVEETTIYSNIDKDYEPKGKKNLSSYRKEEITSTMVEKYKDLKHVRLDNETCAFFDSDNLVGYVAVEQKNDYFTWITALEVTKDYQGYGLGDQLLKYAIDNMDANALSVNKNNKVAYEMYKKAGFYVFDDTDTMYFMTTDPVKAELTEAAIEDPMKFIVDLNKELNKFDYGVKVNGKITDKPEDLDKYYKTESPEEFEKNKCGICYDYALYQDTKLKEAGIPHDNYFVMIPENKKDRMTHSFTVAKVDGDYVYMESSFTKVGGVHIAKNLDDIFNYIVSNMIGDNKGEFDYFIVKYNKSKVGVSAQDYIDDMAKKPTVVDSEYKGGKPTDKGITTESAIEEGYLMTDSDIYYNMDEFNSGEINLCFVTGHMGSGKSTMVADMSAQDPNLETYCIDDIEFNFCYSDNDLKRYGDLIYSFFQDDAGKPYRTWTNNMTGQMVWGQDARSYQYVKDADTAFVKYAMKYAKTHKNKKYVLEGIEIFEFMEPEDFKNYAVCIKGTSAIKSAYRATKRDLSHAKDSQAKSDTLKKKLRELQPVFTVDEKDIKKFRKYFTKLNERKKVNSGDYVYESVEEINESDIGYLGKDGFVKYTNSPDTAIVSCSALITDDEGKILVEDHVKCGGLNLPGGKENPDESIEEALSRELNEELGITVKDDDTKLLCVNTFMCEYPNGSGSFSWFKDYCYYITHYDGEIENLEPDKHDDIKFVSLAEIQKLEADNEPVSELLRCVLKYIKDYYCPEGELPQDKITMSGYVDDLEIVRSIANVDFYRTLLEDIGYEDIDNIYVPKINIISCDREHVEIGMQQNGEDVINIFVPTFGTGYCPYKTVEDYLSYLAFLMTTGIIECIYEKVPAPIAECFARYIIGISTDENEEKFIDDMIGVNTPAYILKAINDGDMSANDFYLKAKKYGCNEKAFKTIDDVVQEKSADTAENLTNKIKFRTKVKNKIAVNKIARKAEEASDKIKDDATPDPIPKKSKNAQPQIDTDTKVEPKDNKEKDIKKEEPKQIEESMLEALANDEYIVYGDYVTFFTEDASNDTLLRRILWSERMVKRKEVVALLDRVKTDCPFIKYAYPELKRYQQRNLFVDLYYYNQAFFKNNEWKGLKAFNLYRDLLDRLINDKRIKNAGYIRRTVFIPVNDWHQNPSTRMWMYKEDLNPISVIYQLMMTNPGALKKLFKDVGVVFYTKDLYFTVDFNAIDKKTALKFRTFINKINKGEEFDAEDIDTTENTPSKEAIKTTIMDDIEVSKGVDLTAANNKVQAEKPGTPAAIVANAPQSIGVAIKKEPEEKKEETHTTATPARRRAKPAASVATMAALDSKVKKAAEKQIAQQNDNVKEVEKTVSKATANKPVTDDNIKKDEQIEKDIVKAIDNSLDNDYITDVDDAYDAMDDDQTLKDLLISLDSMKDNSVNITQARADRMTELDKQLLDKSLRGRTIREILDKDADPTKPVEIPTTDLPVASPNPEWKDVSYMNFDKTYDMEKDIVNAFEHFTTVSRPMAIRNISVQDNSTSEDFIDVYTCEYEDYRGKRFTIKLDIPKVIEDRFMIRGDKRMIQTQFFNMPIVKTADDVCQIVTNYKKIIISRYNTSSGKSMPYATRLIKAADKYTGRRIKFTPGDNTLICAKYDLPIDYIDLSSVFSKIETDVITIYFNQDEIRKTYEIDETKGVPFAVNKEKNEIIYYPDDEVVPFSDIIINMICEKKDNGYDSDFYDLFCSMKEASKGTYTRAKIMGSEIPLVVVCAYHDGLTTVMKKANIDYEIVEKLNSEIRSDINRDTIRFKDGYIVYKIDYNSSLLLNGLKDCDCILHSVAEIDDKNMYLEFLDDFGGRIKADGLENFYDCEIDPICKETLAYYKLPTEYISVLLYANRLLADNKFVKHTNVSSRRARRFELVAAYTYQVLAEAYSSYATSVKHNRNGASFSCKQSAVIDKILQDPTSSDYSTINMLNDIESTNAITTKGLSGLNANRSYSLDKRTYDDSMLNVVGMSTGFSANVGITRQATMDMNIEGSRGYVKDINGNTADLNSAKTLTATEAVVPLCTTHDDPFRVAMTFIQSSKHAVRTEHSDPLLVTNGADEALPYMCSDEFAYKAKQNGTVKELNDDYMIVEYEDGSKDYINLDETIQKNSDGGFYVPLKLDADPKLKVGSKITPNQILAYDKTSLSNSAGEDDNLAYDVGTLAKVAIINMDEGFEDSGIVTEGLAKKLTARIIYKEDCILDKGTNVYNLAKVGQHVEQGDTLLMWQTPYDEEEVNNLLKALANDREALSELGRHTVKSEVTGTLVGIKMYRTVELDELSDSLKEALREYEKPIAELKKRLKEEDIDTSTLPANYPLKPAGKLKKVADGVLIEFYVEYDDIVGVGDKITYNAANKAVIKSVIPEGKEPYTDFRPNEPISALVSSTSIAKRMVTSTRVYGYLQKLMIELDRSCKDLAGIPYDDSEV